MILFRLCFITVCVLSQIECKCGEWYDYGPSSKGEDPEKFLILLSISGNDKEIPYHHIAHKEIALREYLSNDNAYVKVYDVCGSHSELLEVLLSYLLGTSTLPTLVSYMSSEMSLLTAKLLSSMQGMKIKYLAMLFGEPRFASQVLSDNKSPKSISHLFTSLIFDRMTDFDIVKASPQTVSTNIGGGDLMYDTMKAYCLCTGNTKDVRCQKYLKNTKQLQCHVLHVAFCETEVNKCTCERYDAAFTTLTTMLGKKKTIIHKFYTIQTNQDYISLTNMIDKATFPLIMYFETSEREMKYFESLNPIFTKASSRVYNNYPVFITDCKTSTFTFNKSKCKERKTIISPDWLGLDTQITKGTITNNTQLFEGLLDGNYQCLKPCGPGMTKKVKYYSKTVKNTMFECVECSNNSVKSTVGFHYCQDCDVKNGWFANNNKSICIDTFITYSMKLTDEQSIHMISLCGIILSSIVAGLFVFIKYIDSPIVKLSNIWMTFLQLGAMSILVILLPFLFIGDPNSVICITRQLVTSTFVPVILVATIIKCKLIYYITTSKTKQNLKKIKKVKAAEIFTLFISITFGLALLAVTLNRDETYVAEYVSRKHRYREKYCTTQQAVQPLLFYFILISFISFYQAYQARHLPIILKDTYIIALSSILTIIIATLTIWFQTMTKRYYDLRVQQFYSILGIITVNFLCLYMYKIFVILRQPEKNSKAYFRQCFDREREKTALKMNRKKKNNDRIHLQNV